MAKLLYGAAMSVDGFIAGPGGDMSWLAAYAGTPNPLAERLVPQIGALLIGARTFHGDDPNRGTDREGAYGGAWKGPSIVLTHNPPTGPVPDTEFVGDLDTAVAAARAAAGDRYVNILGADVARQCLAAGVLDEVLVFIVPALLGDGVRLFDHPGGKHVALERIGDSGAPDATSLWLRVVR